MYIFCYIFIHNKFILNYIKIYYYILPVIIPFHTSVQYLYTMIYNDIQYIRPYSTHTIPLVYHPYFFYSNSPPYTQNHDKSNYGT